MLEIVEANIDQMSVVRDLFLEYANTLDFDLSFQGFAERLYVRPNFQGRGIGRALASAILQRASAFGYQGLRLDTVSSMKAAIQMYRSMGFYSIDPYRENPLPGA